MYNTTCILPLGRKMRKP